MTTQDAQKGVEQLREHPEVQRALKQAAGTPEQAEEQPPVKTRHKLWLGVYLLALVALAGLYYGLRLNALGLGERLVALGLGDLYWSLERLLPLLMRLTLGLVAVVVTLAAAKVIDSYAISRLANVPVEFNLRRVLRLVVALVLVSIALSVLFADWTTTVLSLGLMSLILGFALQTPITSLIGWVYVLVRAPYRVGDRIKIGEATGDVIDIGYLDTTLWEFGGQYLSTDHPSGRIIKFPNSDVLGKAVYNYSWPLFPYIWNEIKFQVSYGSDLEFVARTMQEVTEGELGEQMMEHVKVFRELLAQTPVNHLEVRERPTVFFRVSDNTWVEAIVRYLVHPRDAGPVKNSLILKLLTRLNAEPDRVKFPEGNSR